MKMMRNLAGALLLFSLLIAPIGPQPLRAQDAAVTPEGARHATTVPGRVDSIDLSAMTITLDGKTFDLAKDAAITSGERTLTPEEVWVGTYVIASIDKTTVMALSVLPDGQPE